MEKVAETFSNIGRILGFLLTNGTLSLLFPPDGVELDGRLLIPSENNTLGIISDK